MANREPGKGIRNATALGAAIGAIHGGLTSDMGGTATVRPDHLFGNAGEVIAGSQTLAEGMTHIATSTGTGALSAAAIMGGVHLGLKAWDRFRGDNMNPHQFK